MNNSFHPHPLLFDYLHYLTDSDLHEPTNLHFHFEYLQIQQLHSGHHLRFQSYRLLFHLHPLLNYFPVSAYH